MPAKTKIKGKDNSELRTKIDELYEKASQVSLAKWSLTIAKHVLDIVGLDYHFIDDVNSGFKLTHF